MEDYNNYKIKIKTIGPDNKKELGKNSSILNLSMENHKYNPSSDLAQAVKELNRLLSSFLPTAIEYTPAYEAKPIKLTNAMLKDLGSPDLESFYALALKPRVPKNQESSGIKHFFPKGPESIKDAIDYLNKALIKVDRSIISLENVWPPEKPGLERKLQPLTKQRDEMLAVRLNLLKANTIWAEVKQTTASWPQEAKKLLSEAQKLASLSQNLLASSPSKEKINLNFENNFYENESLETEKPLTKIAADLKQKLDKANKETKLREQWTENLDFFLQDLESLIAATLNTEKEYSVWEASKRQIDKLWQKLNIEDASLAKNSAFNSQELEITLNKLNETEKLINGESENKSKERGENILKGVETLWQTTIKRRILIANYYFTLPKFIGNPQYLEKLFLASALILGRSQGLLEDLKNHILLFNARYSNTQKLRKEVWENIEKIKTPINYQKKLERAERRLNSFNDKLELIKLNTESTVKELQFFNNNQSLALDNLSRQLRAANLEKDRLNEDLISKKQNLSETSKTKSRLVKALKEKTQTLKSLNTDNNSLKIDIENFKQETEKLNHKNKKLVHVYTRDKKLLKQITFQLQELNEEANQKSFNFEGQKLEVKNLVEKRNELLISLETIKQENNTLTKTHSELNEKIKNLEDDLLSKETKIASLEAELKQEKDELQKTEKNCKILKLTVNNYRQKIDKLIVAHQTLAKLLRKRDKELYNSEKEKEDLYLQLDIQNKNILNLVSDKQDLLAELGTSRLHLDNLEKQHQNLISKLEESKKLNTDKDNFTLELEKEIENLKKTVSEDLSPVIDVLAMALWHSEETLKNNKSEYEKKIENVNISFATKEADLRIKTAAGQLAYQAQIKSQQQQAHKNYLLKDELLADSLKRENNLKEEFNFSQLNNNKLNVALATLNKRSQRTLEAFKKLRKTYQHDSIEAEENQNSLSSLIKRQALEINKHQEKLNGLIPLVSFFLENANLKTDNYKEKAFALPTLLHFLRLENNKLHLDLQEEKKITQSLFAQKNQLLENQKNITQHLAAFKPLVEFLAKTFVKNISHLTKVRIERNQLLEEIDTLKLQHGLVKYTLDHPNKKDVALKQELNVFKEKCSNLEKTLKDHKADLSNLKERIFTLNREKNELQNIFLYNDQELNEFKDLKEQQLNDELKKQENELIKILRLKEEELSQVLYNQEQNLLEILAQRENELFKLKEAREKELQNIIGQREEELLKLKNQKNINQSSVRINENEIIHLRKEIKKEQKGRYQEDNLFYNNESLLVKQIKNTNEEIKFLKEEHKKEIESLKEDLKNSQYNGKLEASWAALNYLSSKADDAIIKLRVRLDDQVRQVEALHKNLKTKDQTIEELENRQDKLALLYWILVSKSTEEDNILQGELIELSEENYLENTLEETSTKNETSLKIAKETAKRGFFSLILTGALVLGLGGQSIGLASENKNLTIAEKSFANVSEISTNFQADNSYLATRLKSNYLGRSINLSFVNTEERFSGIKAIENKIIGEISLLAKKWGLSQAQYLSILRANFKPSETIYYSDLNKENANFELARKYFPNTIELLLQLENSAKHNNEVNQLLKYAVSLKDKESFYWDRLFINFFKISKNKDEALNGLLNHLSQRKVRQLYFSKTPEFAGRMAPLPHLENLGLENFSHIMADYIRIYWFSKASNKQTARNVLIKKSEEMAEDLFFTAKLYKLPLGFFASILHKENEDILYSPYNNTTLALYGSGNFLARLIKENSEYWTEDQPPLCDLDRVAANYKNNEFYTQQVYQKKLHLLTYFNKKLNPKNNLLSLA